MAARPARSHRPTALAGTQSAWLDFESGAGLDLERPGPLVSSATGSDPGLVTPTVLPSMPDAITTECLPRGPRSTGAMLALTPRDVRERFRVDGELGRGGMGAVHHVRDRALRRQVAVKCMIEDNAGPEARLRFLREFQILAQLEHPNIVPIYDAGTTGGSVSMTMRLIRGQTLLDWLRRHDLSNPTATDAFLDMLLRICDALSYAHARGIVHRDLKPENIMLGQHGEVYVMDWGCAGPILAPDAPPVDEPVTVDPAFAQLDRAGMVMGTANFMSPEQVRGAVEEIDARTDVFGVGALLYTALARQPPYPATSVLAALQQARECAPPSPIKVRPTAALSLGLVAIAMRALAPARADRYQSIDDLREALVSVRRGGWFETVSFDTGELLCAVNEPGEVAFILRSGTAAAYRMDGEHRVRVADLGPGDVVGETSLFTGRIRGTNVEATSPVEAMRLTRASIERELGARTWAGSIVRALAFRFNDADAKLAATQRQIKRYQVLERLRAMLCTAGGPLAVGATAARLDLEPNDLRDLVDAAPDLELDGRADTIQRAP
jgi:CRP-like cAMP-binding protein